MGRLRCYPVYEEALFLERPNRFVMRLSTQAGQIIEAHVPNTGRMEEFCVDRQPFFVAPVAHGKYPYKVVATTYQGQFVFLDTLKVNDIFAQLLKQKCIPEFANAAQIRREVTIGDSKFDFVFAQDRRLVIVEVKSCTLCHNELAMFPDAPTLRGQKHLAALERLAKEQTATTYVVWLILNASAERFLPNLHTDFEYSKLVLASKAVRLKALRLNVCDPVSVDLTSLHEVPLDFETLRAHCHDKGSYLLLLENPVDVTVSVGKLGAIFFRQGWYVYVGSALNGLEARIKRHQRMQKKCFWHIDYLASTVMPVRKVYPFRRTERIEAELARQLAAICDETILGFGASDSPASSHLLYFQTYPLRQRAFVDLIFDARTV